MYGELGNQNMLNNLVRAHDKKYHHILLYAVTYNRLVNTPACMLNTPAEYASWDTECVCSIAEEAAANIIGLWL